MLKSILTAAVLLAAGAARAADEGERDLAAERLVEEKCLDCHGDPALHGSRADGKLHHVYVDPVRYRKSIHYSKDLTCLSCHPGSNADWHPREGVVMRECGSCHDHEDELADFRKSTHGRLGQDGNPDAPACFNCHSNHYTMTKTDPAARVNRKNIAQTCGKCHSGEAPAGSMLSAIAAGRLSAHGKGGFSHSYEESACSDCHFGADTHRDPPAGERPYCASCHDRTAGRSRAIGIVHIRSTDNSGLALLPVRAAGLLLTLGAAALLFFPALTLAIRARRRKREGGEVGN